MITPSEMRVRLGLDEADTHADALIAIAEGPVKALTNGETVFECTVGAGFATVSGGNSVSVLTDSLTITKDRTK